jgi:hypothetical protein
VGATRPLGRSGAGPDCAFGAHARSNGPCCSTAAAPWRVTTLHGTPAESSVPSCNSRVMVASGRVIISTAVVWEYNQQRKKALAGYWTSGQSICLSSSPGFVNSARTGPHFGR